MTNDEMLKATSGRDTEGIKPLDIEELCKRSERLDQLEVDYAAHVQDMDASLDRLERENRGLRAHCERLQKGALRSIRASDPDKVHPRDWQAIHRMVTKDCEITPSQSLAEIKAQAIEMYADLDDEYGNAGHRCCPRQFAEQLRKEAE